VTRWSDNELLLAGPWSGNIREMQNILDRSVILCSGDTLSIDEAWWSSQVPLRPDGSDPLPLTLHDQEREMITTFPSCALAQRP
jgi:DNA-binding NtrC family response regulator